jgi:hypothetical protein
MAIQKVVVHFYEILYEANVKIIPASVTDSVSGKFSDNIWRRYLLNILADHGMKRAV